MASAAYRFNMDSFHTTTETHTTTRRMSGSGRGGSSSLEEGGVGATPGSSLLSSAESMSVNGQPGGGSVKSSGCSAARAKSCMKMFFAQLFSHVGLCALVIGYAIMGAFIFVYLEKANELQTRVKVGDTRKVTLDELYNITGRTGL